MAYVVLDLETTGLDPQKDTIIEVGAVRFEDPQALGQPGSYEVLQFLVNPMRRLEPVITNLTGISDEDLAEQNQWGEVKPRVQEFLSLPTTHFVAHNVDFEYAFLTQHEIDLSQLTLLDTYDLAFMVLPQVQQLGLASLCGTFGIDTGRSHRALDDALATARLFAHILRPWQNLPDELLQQLLAHCPRNGWGVRELWSDIASAGGLADLDRNQPVTFPLSKREDPLSAHSGEVSLACTEQSPSIPESRPEWEGRLSELLTAGESSVLAMNPDKGRREGVAQEALRWANERDGRILLGIPNFRNDLDGHSLIHAIEPAGAGDSSVLANPNKFLDVDRLNIWKAGRFLDMGETRLFGKILHWASSNSLAEPPHLRHELDKILWPLLADQLHQPGGTNTELPCLVPPRNSIIDAPITVTDHETLIRSLQEIPGFASDFDAIIVDDIWHLTQNLPYFATQSQTLNHFRYFLGQLSTVAARTEGCDAGMVLGSMPGLPEYFSGLTAAVQNVEEALQDFQAKVGALWRSEQEATESRPTYVISKSVLELRGKPQFECLVDSWNPLARRLRDLLAAGEAIIDAIPAIDADEEPVQSRFIVQLQGWLSGIAAFLQVVDEVMHESELSSEVRKESVFWLEFRNHTDSCKFNITQYCGEGFWEEQALSQCDSVLFLHVGRGTPKRGGYITQRLGISHLDQVRIDPATAETNEILIANPRGLPEPSAKEFRNIVDALLPRLASQVTGNAIFVLGNFAQRRSLAALLRKSFAGQTTTILEDEQEDADTIFEAMASERPVIFCCTSRALQSYDWETTDIQCVVAERLPFTQFQDPILDHQSRFSPKQLNGFYDQTLPICAYNLMRTADLLKSSKGKQLAFVVLDARIVTKRYGERLKMALPQGRWVHPSLEEVPRTLGTWLTRT